MSITTHYLRLPVAFNSAWCQIFHPPIDRMGRAGRTSPTLSALLAHDTSDPRRVLCEFHTWPLHSYRFKHGLVGVTVWAVLVCTLRRTLRWRLRRWLCWRLDAEPL